MLTALSCLVALTAVCIAQYLRAQRIHRPLAQRQPTRQTQDVPLGMEALDLDEVSRTNRRNESLERGQTNWLHRGGFYGRPDSDVLPLADDETYAARYHRAFAKSTKEDT
ncbi:MAG: hypothetical protein AAF943_11645 [Pseudomonadota bacterium]